jgi:phage terminase large subunit-like protein
LHPARYKGAHGGRGSGKSHFFAELAVESCLLAQGRRIVCVREVQKSLKESVKRLIEDKIGAMGVGVQFDIRNDHIVTPGGGVILFQGMQDHTAESIKSLEGFDVAYVEEAQTLSARSLEMLRPTIRKDDSELWFSWNPRSAEDPVDKFLRGLNKPKGAVVVQANWKDNPFFPAVLADERDHDRTANPDRYGHIWEGDYEPAAVGAIWNRAMLHTWRKEKAPPLKRIVVAIDPQGKKELEPGETDETGIVAAGLGEDKRAYVLADATLNGTPREWATRALSVYDQLGADSIVVERNFGGDMVKHTIESMRPGVRVIEVVATRGKHVRAEPISALYEQGQCSHVGTFIELENEMCLTTAWGYSGKNSPNRMDALVWAMTELFPDLTPKRPQEPPRAPRARPGANNWMGA